MLYDVNNQIKDRSIVDYRTRFNDLIDELFEYKLYDYEGNMFPHEKRVHICNKLLEDFYEDNEEYPPSMMLERLSNYILKKDIQRRKGFKVEHGGSYPYLSHRQFKSRLMREVNFTRAINYTTTGENVVTPTRYERIKSELAQLIIK